MTKQAKTSAAGLAGLALVAALSLGASSAAQARDGDDVFWSIGMSSPGVRVAVSNGLFQPVIAPVVVHAPPQRVVMLPTYVSEHRRPVRHGWYGRHARHEHDARREERRGEHGRFEGHGRGDRDGYGPRMGGERGQPQAQARGEAHMGHRR